MADAPLKILCLHGLGQNAEIFNKATGAFRKHYKKIASFHFISAPFVNDEEFQVKRQLEKGITEDTYTWFKFINPQTQPGGRIECDGFEGLNESIELVKKTIAEQGPFDGILGFSQGGCIAGMLASSEHFRFAIFAGSRFPDLGLSSEMSDALAAHCLGSSTQIPSLHLHGEQDMVIPAKMTLEMAAKYGAHPVTVAEDIRALREKGESCFSYQHPGGHFVPSSKEAAAVISEFLNAFVKKD